MRSVIEEEYQKTLSAYVPFYQTRYRLTLAMTILPNQPLKPANPVHLQPQQHNTFHLLEKPIQDTRDLNGGRKMDVPVLRV